MRYAKKQKQNKTKKNEKQKKKYGPYTEKKQQ